MRAFVPTVKCLCLELGTWGTEWMACVLWSCTLKAQDARRLGSRKPAGLRVSGAHCSPGRAPEPHLPARLALILLAVCASGFSPVVVQSLSPVRPFATPWTAARQASLPFTISWSLRKLMSTESGMLANHFHL